jgi:hypothetical protein
MSTFVRRNLTFAWLTVISFAVVFMGWVQATTERKVTNFDEINVHRINVIEPDGKPRVIISSRALIPGIYWKGKEYKHANRDEGGFLFFNDDGTEAGGMNFGNRKQGDQYGAGSSLLFDHYNQQEAVGLIYNERNGNRTAGLRVWDQPKESMFPFIEMMDKAARAPSPAERDKLLKEMNDKAKALGTVFSERVFAGKDSDSALVKLSDKQGRPRLLLKVDAEGQASIEFLDDAGKVVRRIPEA